MGVVAFDTHQAVISLRNSGFSDNQAESIVGVMVSNRDDLATKTDLQLLSAQMLAGFKELEMKLTVRMGVMFFSGITINIAILNFLLKPH